MKKFIILFIVIVSIANCTSIRNEILNYTQQAKAIMHDVLVNDRHNCWNQLAYLCDTFGPRIINSKNLENAIEYLKTLFAKEGFENIREQLVTVPHWIRGEESLEMIQPRKYKLNFIGIGQSVPTPENGISGEAIVIKDFDELERRKDEIKGKIVVYNPVWKNYGYNSQFRTTGADRAAKYGAIAVLVRSATPFSLDTPHTGTLSYSGEVKKIPAAAITVEDAEMIERIYKRGQKIVFHLKLLHKILPDTKIPNLLAEIKGSTYPNEIVVVGGHIDSWDIGTGAMDDAGGVFISYQAMRVLKRLNLRPKRTIRLVAWTAEEFGIFGGKAYAEYEKNNIHNHILAFESDNGVFEPEGFGFTGKPEAKKILEEIAELTKALNTSRIFDGGSQPDTDPLIQLGVPGLSMRTKNEDYMLYHHTGADHPNVLDPNHMDKASASLAVLIYVIADMNTKLPR